MVKYLAEEYGNAGSRTHEYGARAKQAVEKARDQVAAVVRAQRDEIVFTSGATEGNNIAILGLCEHGLGSGKQHIVSTAIEHKAVLEPLEVLAKRGFEVTLVKPGITGQVDAGEVLAAVRPDTLLVSVMHANNETGVLQPISAIADGLQDSEVFFHVDAAQTFGKEIDTLRNPRIDLISASAHKVYGPKGVGALICRRRGMYRLPLSPIQFGGGQERGLRPGTQPVHLIAGFGAACEIALKQHDGRREYCKEIKSVLVQAFFELGAQVNGDQTACLDHTLNVSLPGVDSEAAMVALKGVISVSNGSACTSTSYTPSHVLVAMGFDRDRIDSALRLSWCHLTPKDLPTAEIKARLQQLII